MRILFLDSGYPGRLGPLAGLLGADADNEVLFASSRQRRDYSLPGVRRVLLRRHAPKAPAAGTDERVAASLWQEALKTGESAAASLRAVAERGFAPDMVFAHAAGGAAFFAPLVFPAAFHVAYADSGPRSGPLTPVSQRVRIDLQSIQFMRSQCCFAFSDRRREQFPLLVREGISLVPPFVDTQVFSRAAAGHFAGFDIPGAADERDAPIVVVNGRGLAPRDFVAALRFCLGLLAARGDVRVALLTDNSGQSRAAAGAARSLSAVAAGRLLAVDFLAFTAYRDLLACAALVICPVAQARREPCVSFLLEAMSCECLLMAPAALVAQVNFLRPGVNMLELPAEGPQASPDASPRASSAASPGVSPAGAAVRAALQALEQALQHAGMREASPLGRMARRNVCAHFDQAVVAPGHLALVMQAWAAWKKKRDRA